MVRKNKNLRTCSWRRKGDNSREREKQKNRSVQADSQGHVSHYPELMSRVLPVGFLTESIVVSVSSSETQGQIVGARESLNG